MRRLGVLCAIALLAGCSGSTSVRPFGGSYNLISMDGQPDPQPLVRGTTSPELLGGTLTVGADTMSVTLSLQSLDSAGRPTGDVEPLASEIPYVRHGDSLLVVFDTTGLGGGLVVSGPTAIGVILGSNVALTLAIPIVSSTGFDAQTRRFLFGPAP